MWLKMGLLGLIAFLVYFIIVLLSGRDHMKKQSQHWLIYALLASIVALFVTHTFSPYLNHPIGIVWMLFVLPFINTNRWGKKIEEKIYQQEIFDSPQRAVVSSRLAKIHSREN